MSNTTGFFISRFDDRKLLNAFDIICKNYLDHIYSITIELSTTDSITITRANGLQSFLEAVTISELLSEKGHLINRINLTLKNLHIILTRGERLANTSPLFDYISFEITQNSGSPEIGELKDLDTKTKILISKELQKQLGSSSHAKLLSSNLPKEYDALISQHNNMLSRLEDLNSQLIENNHSKIQDLDIEYTQKKSKLELEYSELKKQIGEEYKQKNIELDSSFKEKNETLKEKEREIDSRASQLDDRGNTHVRREIRDRMLSDVKDRVNKFGLSEATNSKRTPVLWGIIFLLFILSSLLCASLWEGSLIYKRNMVQLETIRNISEKISDSKEKSTISPETLAKIASIPADTDNSSMYWIWIRSGLLSFGIFGTILYYIKWQNRWADHHSNSEFQLQQFYIDVNRANWVIESCLEWTKETKSEIPTTLLESVTKNLFIGEHKSLEQVKHPADELASAIMGSASKLKMNLGGNEIEINNPGKIKPKN